MFTISTMQVDDGRIELLNPNEIIPRNTSKKPNASERLVAGAVQSELNSIFNTQLDVDGWYGHQSAGTVADLQKELSLPATGVLDVQTFYQLQLAVESGAKYKRSGAQTAAGTGKQPIAGNTGTNYAPPSSVWGDYNGNGIPDQYEGYAQGTSYKAYGSVGFNYAPSSIQGDYNGNGIPDQYDSYAQGTGNRGFGDFRVAQETGNSSKQSTSNNILTGIRDAAQGFAAGVICTIPGAEWTVQMIQYHLVTPGTYCDYDYLRETNDVYKAGYDIGNLSIAAISLKGNPFANNASVITSTGEVVSVAGSVESSLSIAGIISAICGGSSSQGRSNSNLDN